MKLIALKNSPWKAKVDDEDFEWLNKYSWRLEKSGYVIAHVSRVGNVRMHKLVQEGKLIDHKDGDKLNNTKDNLISSNHSLNAANRPKKLGCSSKYLGVSWNAQASNWRASCSINNIVTNLGHFKTEEEAAREYDRAVLMLRGPLAKTNFLKPEESL